MGLYMSEEDWYTICNEKDILLQKNDENIYKIDFLLKDKESEYTLINLIKANQLFDLLFELNKDIAESINTVNSSNDSQYTVIHIINKNIDLINEKIIHIHLQYQYIFDTNKCILKPIVINRKEDDSQTLIYMDNFRVEIEESVDNPTKIHLLFGFNNKFFESNLVHVGIAMYIKKIFYRLKLYFE